MSIVDKRLKDPKYLSAEIIGIWKHFNIDYAWGIYEIITDETLPGKLNSEGQALLAKTLANQAMIDKFVDGSVEVTEDEWNDSIRPLLAHIDHVFVPKDYYDTTILDNDIEYMRDEVVLWLIEKNLQKNRSKPYPCAEDYYKLREDIVKFERLKQNPHFTKIYPDYPENRKEYDIMSAGGMFLFPAELMDLAKKLERYELKRQESKQAARQAFRAAHKEGQNHPHVVIYDGLEGTVVIPQTMEAAQFWGRQTRWCVSAKQKEDNAFETYNKKGPLFIFITKPTAEEKAALAQQYSSYKFALHNGDVFDELDTNFSDGEREHETPLEDKLKPFLRLREAARNALTGGEKDYFELFCFDEYADKVGLELEDLAHEKQNLGRRNQNMWHLNSVFFGGPLTTDIDVIDTIVREREGAFGVRRIQVSESEPAPGGTG